MQIRVLKGEAEFDQDFIDRIISLDLANMREILAEAGIEFPEEKRREGFKRNPVLIVAEEFGKIVGYLEYKRSWTDAETIYLSSIQIDKKYRGSMLILRLIDKFLETIEREDFKSFETNVQKNNAAAIRIYRRLGFEFVENPRSSASWLLKADQEILKNSSINLLLEKWRERVRRNGEVF